MKYRRLYPCFLLLILFLNACDAPMQQKEEKSDAYFKQQFIEANQYMRERHRTQIEAFVDRVGWDMAETSSGLWYRIERQGEGPAVTGDRMVHYTYETRLLNGELCYSKDESEPAKLIPDKGNIEGGLVEGLKLLNEGGKGLFIIPPHLAHGNFGDRDKIPGFAILMIEVEVLKVMR